MLSSSLEIWDTSKTEYFKLKFFQIYKKLSQNYCRKSFSSVWESIFGFGDNSIWIGSIKHSILPRENTFHRVSVIYQRVSRFQIPLRENFINHQPFHHTSTIYLSLKMENLHQLVYWVLISNISWFACIF